MKRVMVMMNKNRREEKKRKYWAERPHLQETAENRQLSTLPSLSSTPYRSAIRPENKGTVDG
jgi:hypothetical protein